MATRLPSTAIVYLPELVKLVNSQQDYEVRKQLINMYYTKDLMHHQALRTFVELMWHPDIKWELPEGTPPYTPTSAHVDQAPSSLFKAFKILHRFLAGGSGFLHDKNRRELHFITTLESLSMAEAELLIKIKDKDLSEYPNITLELFVDAIPDILPEEIVEVALAESKKFSNTETQKVSVNLNSDVASNTPDLQTVVKKAGRPAKKSTK
jgi:hypothetical protein